MQRQAIPITYSRTHARQRTPSDLSRQLWDSAWDTEFGSPLSRLRGCGEGAPGPALIEETELEPRL